MQSVWVDARTKSIYMTQAGPGNDAMLARLRPKGQAIVRLPVKNGGHRTDTAYTDIG
ncbi:phage baseplate protein, partial [Staphylococcus aureus]